MMNAYIDPSVRSRFDRLDEGMKQSILARGARLENARDLAAAVSSVIAARQGLPEVSPISSYTECTGLIPRAPVSDAEREAYQGLFSMEIPNES